MAPAKSEETKAYERDALTSRVLPQMVLSSGDEASMTGPPLPTPHYLNAEGRARLRFEVEGNAMYSTLFPAENKS
jgi:sorbose reductase